MRWIFRLAIVLSIGIARVSLAQPILTGDVSLISPPPSVEKDALVDPDEAFLFQEQANFLLPADIFVDIIDPGIYDEAVCCFDFAGVVGGTIGAGTRVDSYYLHADALENSSVIAGGTLTFSQDILGIIGNDRTATSLFDTHSLLGAPGTTYPGFNAFDGGGILDSGTDSITLSADRRVLSFTLGAFSAVDAIRVITAPIPEPTSTVLFGIGSLVVGGALRKKAVVKDMTR